MKNNEYPKREKFFAFKFCRLLAQMEVAMDIGADACWLLTIVVLKEDELRYSKPVRFWNESLQKTCGFRSKHTLISARRRAVKAGWLHYLKGGNRTAAAYFVTIPDKSSSADFALEPASKPHQKQSSSADFDTRTQFERNSNATLSTLSYTYPSNAASKTSFDVGEAFRSFWESVHRKVEKQDARRKFEIAIRKVSKDQGTTKADAAQFIIERMIKFAASPQARNEIKGKLHPATWLHKGRYDDDETTWYETTSSNGQHIPAQPRPSNR